MDSLPDSWVTWVLLEVMCDLGHLCTYKLEKDDGFHMKYIGYGPLPTLVANGACKYEESICSGVGGTPPFLAVGFTPHCELR